MKKVIRLRQVLFLISYFISKLCNEIFEGWKVQMRKIELVSNFRLTQIDIVSTFLVIKKYGTSKFDFKFKIKRKILNIFIFKKDKNSVIFAHLR